MSVRSGRCMAQGILRRGPLPESRGPRREVRPRAAPSLFQWPGWTAGRAAPGGGATPQAESISMR